LNILLQLEKFKREWKILIIKTHTRLISDLQNHKVPRIMITLRKMILKLQKILLPKLTLRLVQVWRTKLFLSCQYHWHKFIHLNQQVLSHHLKICSTMYPFNWNHQLILETSKKVMISFITSTSTNMSITLEIIFNLTAHSISIQSTLQD